MASHLFLGMREGQSKKTLPESETKRKGRIPAWEEACSP